jgi:hypothetical protein
MLSPVLTEVKKIHLGEASDQQSNSLIQCDISYIKELDISLKRVYPFFNSHTFSLPVNFHHNRNLPELAMKACRSKVLKVKPLRDFGSPLEAFSFRG